MIPKIIHYCWFGKGEKPEQVIKYITLWKQKNPDYDIKEWNESNFDYQQWKFCREAYQVKKFAFVSDVCRLYALLTEGGIYLDTDIEMIKNFDPFLSDKSFVGEERNHTIGSGCIGAEKGTSWVKDFLETYNTREFINYKGRLLDYPNTMYLTDFIRKYQQKPKIYPIDFFCAKDYETKEVFITENTVCIHQYAASWFEKLTLKKKITNLIAKYKANN